jgi:hypothetical protein
MCGEQDVWTDGRSTKRRSNKAITPRIDQSPRTSPTRRRDGKRGDQSESPHAAAKVRGKRLLELDNNSCRWPLGNPGTARFMFCGAPEANLECGIPYCRRHMQRAYLRPGRPLRKESLAAVPTSEPTSAAPNTTVSRASTRRSPVHNPAT